MANSRSKFGSVRRTAAGNYQARYTGPDRVRTPAGVFKTEADAWRHLRKVEHEIESGSHASPAKRKITLECYIEQEWRKRRTVGPSTAELYDHTIKLHIVGVSDHKTIKPPSPRIGQMTLDRLTPSVIEKWHRNRTETTGPRAVSQAYSLLRSILNMARRDRLIPFNPCEIRGAGVANPPERPLITEEQAQALLMAMPVQHRTAYIVTLWAHLRRGELLGLRRGDVDLEAGTITVERQVRRIGGTATTTATKTRRARTIYLPEQALSALSFHLSSTGPGLPSAPLFLHVNGKPLADHHLRRSWDTARGAVGLGSCRRHSNSVHFRRLKSEQVSAV